MPSYEEKCIEWFEKNQTKGQVLVKVAKEIESYTCGWNNGWTEAMTNKIGGYFILKKELFNYLSSTGILLLTKDCLNKEELKNFKDDPKQHYYYPIECFDIITQCEYKK